MKTAISIPEDTYLSAERLAKRLGKSRSQLYTQALQSYLKCQNSAEVTKKLDEIYDSGDASSLDPAFRKAQSRSLPKGEW